MVICYLKRSNSGTISLLREAKVANLNETELRNSIFVTFSSIICDNVVLNTKSLSKSQSLRPPSSVPRFPASLVAKKRFVFFSTLSFLLHWHCANCAVFSASLLGRSVDQNLDRVWQEAWFSKSCRSWARAVAILLTAMFFVVVLSHSQSQNFAKRPKSLTESLKA